MNHSAGQIPVKLLCNKFNPAKAAIERNHGLTSCESPTPSSTTTPASRLTRCSHCRVITVQYYDGDPLNLSDRHSHRHVSRIFSGTGGVWLGTGCLMHWPARGPRPTRTHPRSLIALEASRQQTVDKTAGTHEHRLEGDLVCSMGSITEG